MCLGASAKAQNEAARRDYKYRIEQREQDWMQQLSLAGAERVQYEVGINRSGLRTQDQYAKIQQQQNEAISQAYRAEETDLIKFLQNNQYDKSLASGQTGRSIARRGVLDVGALLKERAKRNYLLTTNEYKMKEQFKDIREQQKLTDEQLFNKVRYIKQPGLEPPQPVMQSVGAAMFMDALGIAASVAGIKAGFN